MSQSATVMQTDPPAESSSPTLAAKAITRQSLTPVNVGWICVFAALVLSMVGLLAIGTTTKDYLLTRQFVLMMVGLFTAAMLAVPHYQWMRRLSYPMLVVVLGLLVFLLVPGVPEFLVRPRNGARRWINVVVTEVQPSELAKIAFVLSLACYLRYRSNYRRFRGLALPFALTFIPMALIVKEPDLGTALLFLPTLFAMLVAAGAKLKHLIIIMLLGVTLAPAMYPLLQPHQKSRIQALIAQVTGDSSRDQKEGFQGDHARTIVGAGGVTGVGARHARDLIKHYGLPEEHNDMIFAVICARWGMLGGVAVILTFLLFCVGGVLAAGFCRDPFGRLVAVGFVAIIFAQATINIGMTVGVLPITGMTLPFISYGGSSLVANWMMVGIILNIAMRRPRMLTRESFEFKGANHDG